MKKMRSSFNFLFCLLCVVVICFNACSKDEIPDNEFTLFATLNGSNAVPPNSATATGTCNITYDSITNQLAYTIVWNGLTGVPGSVVFENGTPGNLDFNEIPLPDVPSKESSGISGYITLNQDYEPNLINNNFFVSIRTANYGSGEIRGQLTKQ